MAVSAKVVLLILAFAKTPRVMKNETVSKAIEIRMGQLSTERNARWSSQK